MSVFSRVLLSTLLGWLLVALSVDLLAFTFGTGKGHTFVFRASGFWSTIVCLWHFFGIDVFVAEVIDRGGCSVCQWVREALHLLLNVILDVAQLQAVIELLGP